MSLLSNSCVSLSKKLLDSAFSSLTFFSMLPSSLSWLRCRKISVAVRKGTSSCLRLCSVVFSKLVSSVANIINPSSF